MNKLKAIIVNLCRFLIAIIFIFSGYVKAIDPIGTQYKLEEYLETLHIASFVPSWAVIGFAILMATIEFSLGIFALFAIRRRFVSKCLLAIMVVMTIITLILYVFNPISDCGCFGDAIKLTNAQTLIKNVVLLVCAVIMAYKPLKMIRFISKSNQWIIINYTVLFALITSAYCLYYLPIFDFRPYKIGTNIKEKMEIPKDAEQPQFETTFILEKNGVKKEFTLNNYPDSTWTFIDSKTIKTKEGYIPPIHDFSVTNNEGDDITQQILNYKGYTFLLIAPWLETADDSDFGDIDRVYEYCLENKIPFYCLTASGRKGIEYWINATGAEYPIYSTDGTTLKTIVRSNPGLLLLKNGTIINKWGHNNFPQDQQLIGKINKLKIAKQQIVSNETKILKVFLYFLLPLIVLSIADRLWAWSYWVKQKEALIYKYTKNKENKN